MAFAFNPVRLLIWGIFPVLLFSFCSKETDYTPRSPSAPVLALSGQIDLSDGIRVLVSKAVPIGQQAFFDTLYVKNALVFVKDSAGTIFPVPHAADGIYLRDTTGMQLKPGCKYRLFVSGVPGYKDVESDFVTIPSNSGQVKNIDIHPNGAYNSNIPLGEGVIEFSDDPGTKNTYLVRCMAKSGNNKAINLDYGVSTVQLCTVLRYYGLPDAVLQDDCINGAAAAKLHIEGQLNALDSKGFSTPADQVSIWFGTASDQYYAYIGALLQPEDIEKGLAEPKPSYTNIKGGIGVFYATNLIKKVFSF